MAQKASAVLIIGQNADPHVKAVASALKRRPIILDCHTFSEVTYLPCERRLSIQGKLVRADTISGIWWRLKWPAMAPDNSLTGLSEAQRSFWRHEWANLLWALRHHLSDRPSHNDPGLSQRASYKPFQLQIARACGFKIPKTIVSNAPESVIRFARKEDTFIIKRLSARTPDAEIDGIHLGLAEASLKVVQAEPDAVRFCPAIYQEKVEKEFELRVNVIGEEIFAIRINSQTCSGAATDWRRSVNTVSYETYEIEEDLRHKLLLYMRAFGLSFGAFDLAINREGHAIFFECNPEGQWLWLEHETRQPISKSVARRLESGAMAERNNLWSA